jgi:hypothetical protein
LAEFDLEHREGCSQLAPNAGQYEFLWSARPMQAGSVRRARQEAKRDHELLRDPA